jgi:CheY-like chemotaxis protein
MVTDDEYTSYRLERILIADDFPQQAETLAKWLRRQGYTVEVATDGEETLAAADRFMPHAIVLDIRMPKLDGYEVAACVRQRDWGKDALIIALTAFGVTRDSYRIAAATFDEFLIKPISPSDIASLLAERWQDRHGYPAQKPLLEKS